MRNNFDEYILSYTVLRIHAGLDHIISSREPDYLGRSGESIRGQWQSVSRLLQEIARMILNPNAVDWQRAGRVGLTEEMLDLKRETLDASLGRWEPAREFNTRVERIAKDEVARAEFFSPERILIRGGSRKGVSREAFLSLAKDLLASIAKILKLDDALELVNEFISVVETAMKLTRQGS